MDEPVCKWCIACLGLVPPAAAVFLMGRSGAILIVTMLFMAVTSAGSAELVAVSSLFTYDIYRTYINPKATGKAAPCLCILASEVLHAVTCIL